MPRVVTSPRRWSRHLRIGLLVAVALAGLMIAAIERHRGEDVFKIWETASGALGIYTRPISDVSRRVVDGLRGMNSMRQAKVELDETRRGLRRAELENQLLREQLRRHERLAGQGMWSGPPELTFLSADVVALHTMEGSAEVTINRGRRDGVRARDPVVATGGLFGVVRLVYERNARVQSLSDPRSVVGALSVEGRARGMVRGAGRGAPLEFIAEHEMQPIQLGAHLISSGFENSIYPKGLLIGEVSGVDNNAYGITYGVVRPEVEFDSVEEVLVIMPADRDGATGDPPTTASLSRFTLSTPGFQGDAPTTAAISDSHTTGSADAPATSDTLTTATTPATTRTQDTATPSLPAIPVESGGLD